MGMRLAFMMMICLLVEITCFPSYSFAQNSDQDFLDAITWFPSYSFAQNSDAQDFLDGHNAARAQVGVGPMRWDNALATYALNYANSQKGRCPYLTHSGGPYGETLVASTGALSAREAVQLWVSEKQYYNYASNSCAAGQVCGHYIQVVWRDSVRLGCARVKCTNIPEKHLGWYVICSYAPKGNIPGMRPY